MSGGASDRRKEINAASRAIRDTVLDWKSIDEDTRETFMNSPFFSECESAAPFFSEGFLYCLLGKEEGRVVLALVNRLLRAIGEETC